MKIAIFIPAYNAATTIPLVIDRIPEQIKKEVKEIFVIDNASPDNTYLTVIGYKQLKEINNLSVIRNDINKGYGGSQKIAYEYAIEKGYDAIVMLHGDAQYAPEKLPALLEAMKENNADLVFGSRIQGNPLKGGMPLWRFIGNRALTFFQNRVLGTNFSEFHSGYRVYDCNALKKIPFNLCSDNYHFDTEIFVQCVINNLKIMEVTIPTHYGPESKSPSVKQTVNYCMNVVKTMFKYLLHKRGIKKLEMFEVHHD